MNDKIEDKAELMRALAPVISSFVLKVAEQVAQPLDARIKSLSARVADLEERLGVKR